ncbi:2OG-Fe(II) oxygenase [uncultured Tateyamaria sp.]|uniref:2OG-Fe(II) oxygenase n=1 Tax=uncultured Tateyamaria sp. TaxID=455651 RepID=UPI00261C8D12|nr:2OG-Fe(II) oxygenase [uncultured Tateyamaria sp.]
MTAYYTIDPDTLLIENDVAKAAGAAKAEAYQSAEPYHHGCIDNFLPEAVLDRVLEELGTMPEAETSFSRAQENLKSSFIPERLPNYTKNLFYAFNARPFILFLEQMTGIKGLIPDPYFMGAGIHKTLNGGHLDIHADFNFHGQMRVERRLNVLIYLNRDWKEEYGGSFEVWDKGMTTKMASFVPTYNRMVCFSTGSDTFHGNPEPVNHPDGEPRQSIALYYYTATWDASRKGHGTLFKPRPGTVDQADKLEARRAVIQDILPPIVYRRLAGPLRRLGL